MIITNATLQQLALNLWDDYCEIFPKLTKFDCPKVIINNRLKSCAGRNFTEDNLIDLAGKFLTAYPENMLRVILPHELAHQIDYDLNGWYNRKPHHGKDWITIMVKIGQAPNPYHNMKL